MTDNIAAPFGVSQDSYKALLTLFARYPEVDRVVIYGSRAKGTAREGSDIDLTIEGRGIDLSLQLELQTAIEELLIPYKVDLSIFADLTEPALIDHIKRVGKSFYQKA